PYAQLPGRVHDPRRLLPRDPLSEERGCRADTPEVPASEDDPCDRDPALAELPPFHLVVSPGSTHQLRAAANTSHASVLGRPRTFQYAASLRPGHARFSPANQTRAPRRDHYAASGAATGVRTTMRASTNTPRSGPNAQTTNTPAYPT